MLDTIVIFHKEPLNYLSWFCLNLKLGFICRLKLPTSTRFWRVRNHQLVNWSASAIWKFAKIRITGEFEFIKVDTSLLILIFHSIKIILQRVRTKNDSGRAVKCRRWVIHQTRDSLDKTVSGLFMYSCSTAVFTKVKFENY